MKTLIQLLVACGILSALMVRAEDAPPNIVLIFIDDMGYADIGPFGNTELRTPHLDKMAAEGMKFTTYYATPVCSMSRASLMTGCYNARISIPGVLFPASKIGLHSDEITLAEVVKQKGYATAAIGKWHLGYQPEFLPTRQGFDHYFGLPYSNDMGGGKEGKRFPPLPLIRDEATIETEPDQSQITKRYTQEAVMFIREHKEKPFFLYLPHTMIHFPLAASADFKGKSKQGLLGDAVEEIDWSVGQILGTLKELGIDDKTLVIFTSDNGPAGRPAPPFRGHKGTNFEGGVREPCLMRWPGKIPAGTTCDEMIGNIDMLPTFAKLVGVEAPKDREIDGRDFSALLQNPKAGPVRDTHLYFGGAIEKESSLFAIRQGDWKLFLKEPSDAPKGKKAAKEDKAKEEEKGGPALYNLVQDPGETKNVAAEHPDIVSRLQKEAGTRVAEIEEHRRPAGNAK